MNDWKSKLQDLSINLSGKFGEMTKTKRVVIIVIAVAVLSSCCCCAPIGFFINGQSQDGADQDVESLPAWVDSATPDEPAESLPETTTTTTTTTPATTTTTTPAMTMGEKNALKKAKSYLDLMAFSYKGLIEQLEFEFPIIFHYISP